ncbi:MAG: LysM peptidoglycan-binding domain-containing protein [Ideonella sp.]|nr:LysM peptidoglycan-binding domain-containing protein [Ideonella sp.]
MSRFHLRPLFTVSLAFSAVLSLFGAHSAALAQGVTTQQQATADKVAQAGIPLSELAADAPDSYTVKRGDTLWDISKLFLKSPWRWPELWGMNKTAVRNPHLIYPGQILVLERTADGKAVLRMGRQVGSNSGTGAEAGITKLSPSIRAEPLTLGAIASVPMHLIGPFLTEAVIFDSNELESAPRVVATQAGRMLVSKGEVAYVRGDVDAARNWQMFRAPKPLRDPQSGRILGFEARHVGVAEVIRRGEANAGAGLGAGGKDLVVPHSIRVTSLREEADVGVRLAPLPARDTDAFAPHSPESPVEGRVVSIYGDGQVAGQNHIVAINRGAQDGMQRGHVLALWTKGGIKRDTTHLDRATLALPDERHGTLFVFRVFERVSYALILQAEQPVQAGDRFSQP